MNKVKPYLLSPTYDEGITNIVDSKKSQLYQNEHVENSNTHMYECRKEKA